MSEPHLGQGWWRLFLTGLVKITVKIIVSLNASAADKFSFIVMLFLANAVSFSLTNLNFCLLLKLYIETLVDFQYPESGKVVWPNPDQLDLFAGLAGH